MSSVRERHQRHGEVWWKGERVDSGDYCCACMGAWPCDAIQMADRADAAEHELSEMTASATAHNSAYIAARADADRLAVALKSYRFDHDHSDEFIDYRNAHGVCSCMRCVQARDALRLHEGAAWSKRRQHEEATR